MRAHLVQPDIVWEDREANHALVDRLLDGVAVEPGDLVVLPEMFDSGFSLRTERTADDGRTLAYVSRLADDLGATVVAGRTLAGCAGGSCGKATNRATVVGPPRWPPPGGVEHLADYAKVHPFSFGREGEAFEGGREVAVFDWHGPAGAVRCCPAVCYDLRFPELFRIGLAMGAEAYVVIANWPAARQGHWRALLVARAIENQALVLGVNRCGDDPHLAYAGGTIAVGPQGEVLGELGGEQGVLSVDADVERVREWRATFAAWRDGRLPPMDRATNAAAQTDADAGA